MLQANYPSLLSKKPGKTLGCITSINDCELLRMILNECTKILRARGNFNASENQNWADIYYQVSVLIFGEQGLTPFKLKLLLMPQLVVSNFIQSPCENLCEALEKSNHRASKGFQSRTMRGGGRLHNQDPLFLKIIFFILQVHQIVSKQCGRCLWRNQSYHIVFTNMSKKFRISESCRQ